MKKVRLELVFRMFLQDELKNGRLKLNADDKARVMEYFPTFEDDPILVFKKEYTAMMLMKLLVNFQVLLKKVKTLIITEKYLKKIWMSLILKLKQKKTLEMGTLMLTDEVREHLPNLMNDVQFAGGGVVKKIIKSITMKKQRSDGFYERTKRSS